MDLCNESSSRSSVCLPCVAKNFSTGPYTQTLQPVFFIPAMLAGTIDLYHFILLSLTLTLAGGHKISIKQNLLASFSHILSISFISLHTLLIRMELDVMFKQYLFSILIP